MQAAVLQGKDAKASLTDAEKSANEQIAEYNAKLGG